MLAGFHFYLASLKTQCGKKNRIFGAKDPIYSLIREIIGIFSCGKYVGCKRSCLDLSKCVGEDGNYVKVANQESWGSRLADVIVL